MAKQLQDDFPWLLPVACAAHRLALACRDALSNVAYMSTFREHLQQLHLYFHNSANRTAVLKSAAQSLGLDALKVMVRSTKKCILFRDENMAVVEDMHGVFYFMLYKQEVKDTRWLSQHLAITTLQRNLPAVLAALAEETEVNKCPLAKGLYGFFCVYRFVAAVYMQADVLPHLARSQRFLRRKT